MLASRLQFKCANSTLILEENNSFTQAMLYENGFVEIKFK